jgi:very-short-patch-repair endonuclease
VIDLVAASTRADEALSWIAQGCQRRLTTPDRLRSELLGRPTVRWRRLVLAAVEDVAAGAHSLLELRYLRDVERAHRLPVGVRQRAVAGRRGREWSDVYYVDYRSTVELDGRVGHERPTDEWRDSRRDNAAVLAGEAALRYGWVEVTTRPCAVAAEVAAVLAVRGWAGRPRKCGTSCAL